MISGGDVTVTYPLFQEENGGSTPTSPLQFYVSKIVHETAKNFVERWHYSGRIPTGKNYCFGLFTSKDLSGKLYAVIVYGIGVNPYQASFLGVENIIEIKRMCRTEPPLKFPLSRFIRLTSKMVSKEFDFDCIVAFADPDQGHEGTVYKASGFILHGTTNQEIHLLDENGNKRHRRVAYRHAKRNNQTIQQSRIDLRMERVKTAAKYRWIRFARRRKNG